MEMTAVDLVYCFALVVIPVHWMPGDQPLPSMPTQLIMDVDSLPLGLGLYPITSGFFMFTPCMKGPLVQGLWCQIFSPGQTIFVCRFVHLAAWCKSLHNVWILPRSAHIQTFWPPSPGPWLKRRALWESGWSLVDVLPLLFWGKMPPQRKYALPPPRRQLFLGGNTSQSPGYAAIPPSHLGFHVWQNILASFACYSQVVLFMGFFVHHQTTENTEIVVKSIQCIQTFLGAKPFWQTPFPNMQRLVVQTYTDLDRHIGGKHKFCVRPSECFIFQPCSFLSLNPAPGLSKIGKPRDFHSFFQPWKLFVRFNISKPVVVWIIYSEQVCHPPFDSLQDLPSKRMDQVWEIMPFYDLLLTPIDNNVLNLLDRILIPCRYVSWGWLSFFGVIFRQSVKFWQYLRPWPSWQWHR